MITCRVCRVCGLMLVGLLCHQPLVVLGNVLGLMERTLFCAPVQNSRSVEEEALGGRKWKGIGEEEGGEGVEGREGGLGGKE